MIPLKAHAWLDLTARKQAGEQVDSKHIRKHRNDVLLLSGQLTEDPIELPDSIRKDLGDFLELVDRQDMDLKSIGLKGKPGDYLARLRTGFGLS